MQGPIMHPFTHSNDSIPWQALWIIPKENISKKQKKHTNSLTKTALQSGLSDPKHLQTLLAILADNHTSFGHELTQTSGMKAPAQ
jgi:hypothetical protein